MKCFSWLRVCAAIALVCLVALLFAPAAAAQYTTVSAVNVGGSSTKVASFTVYWQPVSGCSYGAAIGAARVGSSSGQLQGVPYTANGSGGAFSIAIPDTAQVTPSIAYAVTAINQLTGDTIFGAGLDSDGVHVKGGGPYGCVTPTGSSWNLDTYVPVSATLALGTLGIGSVTLLAPGSMPTAAISGSGPFALNLGIPGGAPGPNCSATSLPGECELPNLANIRYVDPSGVSTAYSTVQAAINSLPTTGNRGGIVYLQPGTYACPTSIPSGTRLVGMGSPFPPNVFTQFNGAAFNSGTPGPTTAALTTFQCPSGLTLQDVSRVAIKNVVIDLQGTGNGVFKGVAGSEFDLAMVNAATTAPVLIYDGDAANGYNTTNNLFEHLYLNGGNAGLQVGNAAGTNPATNSMFRYVAIYVAAQPSGTYTGVNFLGQCDSNIFDRIALRYTNAVTAINGVVFGASTTADTDADLVTINWYDETANPTGGTYNPTGYSIIVNYATNDYIRTGVLMGRSGNISYGAIGAGAFDSPWIWWANQGSGTPNPFGAYSQVPTLKVDSGSKGTPSVSFFKSGVKKASVFTGTNLDDSLYFYVTAPGTVGHFDQTTGKLFLAYGADVAGASTFHDTVNFANTTTVLNAPFAVDDGSSANMLLVNPLTHTINVAGGMDTHFFGSITLDGGFTSALEWGGGASIPSSDNVCRSDGTHCSGSAGTTVADVDVSIPSFVVPHGVPCVGITGTSTPTTFPMPGVSTTMAITPNYIGNPSAINGWGGINGLKIAPWPSASGIGSFVICNGTTVDITSGPITIRMAAR